jgi:hypothetical protein
MIQRADAKLPTETNRNIKIIKHKHNLPEIYTMRLNVYRNAAKLQSYLLGPKSKDSGKHLLQKFVRMAASHQTSSDIVHRSHSQTETQTLL